MAAALLLSRLHKVRSTGKDRWMACCPAHDDRTASLSIRERPDGKVLVNCFAGCCIDEILAAAELEMTDLMPERLPGEHKPIRHAFNAYEALNALVYECTFVQLCAVRLARSEALADSDLYRLHVAANRIKDAMATVGR